MVVLREGIPAQDLENNNDLYDALKAAVQLKPVNAVIENNPLQKSLA